MTSARPGEGPGAPGGPPGPARAYDPDDLPGDPACLLRRVCPACGSVADDEAPVICPACGADMPGG
jgi:hypothetical protein